MKYLCFMKTKLKFTRGELTAVLVLLAVILLSNILYFCKGKKPYPNYKLNEYEATFRKFSENQRRIGDSIAELRKNNSRNTDTLPKFKNQEKKQLYQIVKVDLNSCDTNDLLTIPQFGSKRAVKLVEFREKIGGFHSFSQLQEIFVLQNIDTVRLKDYMYCDKSKIRKININEASYKELSSHPYLDSYITKLILRHRQTKGPIKDLNELQEITHAYPELIDRLRHYVCF